MNTFKKASPFALACAGLLICAATNLPDIANADGPTTRPNSISGAKPSRDPRERGVMAKSNCSLLSKCVGKDVYNREGKRIGSVDEVVLDGGIDRVNYVVLSYGGFMGMGDKLFAVPWGALEHRASEPDRVYVDISEKTLKNAPGFDKDKWPDMADPAFRTQIDTYYNIPDNKRLSNRDSMPDKAEHAKPLDTNLPPTDAKGNPTPAKQGKLWCYRVSKAVEADYVDGQDQKIGHIQEFIVDVPTGNVWYAVVSMTSQQDKLFTIPLAALTPKSDSKEFVSAISTDRIKNGPTFDAKVWPDWNANGYVPSVDQYYSDYLSGKNDNTLSGKPGTSGGPVSINR